MLFLTSPQLFSTKREFSCPFQQIQILWNNLNVGCFYLTNPHSRQQYFELLKKAHNPPQEIKLISVFFDRELVLKLDYRQECSLNLLDFFYSNYPLFFQKNKYKFVCPPPQILLNWEANFCRDCDLPKQARRDRRQS